MLTALGESDNDESGNTGTVVGVSVVIVLLALISMTVVVVIVLRRARQKRRGGIYHINLRNCKQTLLSHTSLNVSSFHF